MRFNYYYYTTTYLQAVLVIYVHLFLPILTVKTILQVTLLQ
jgi:hypothetical protein